MIAKLEPITRPQEAALRRFSFPEPEELSPPIVRVENGTVGYENTAILSRLDLRIDQDDRIALLGQNGEGKSTLSKLISGRLNPMAGRVVTSNKLRIGYFAQHQVDELFIDETPLDHIRRLRPEKHLHSCAPFWGSALVQNRPIPKWGVYLGTKSAAFPAAGND